MPGSPANRQRRITEQLHGVPPRRASVAAAHQNQISQLNYLSANIASCCRRRSVSRCSSQHHRGADRQTATRALAPNGIPRVLAARRAGGNRRTWMHWDVLKLSQLHLNIPPMQVRDGPPWLAVVIGTDAIPHGWNQGTGAPVLTALTLSPRSHLVSSETTRTEGRSTMRIRTGIHCEEPRVQ
jgi:hypothetical protein